MPAGLARAEFGDAVSGLWIPGRIGSEQSVAARALADPSRGVTDFARDEIRRPVEVLEFLGIHSGMTVMDVYAAGGYYTFILSKALGPEGVVLAQNTERGLRFGKTVRRSRRARH